MKTSNSIEKTIKRLIIEKFKTQLKEEEIVDNIILDRFGFEIWEKYELIVAVENYYDIQIAETDVSLASLTVSNLSMCVKKKAIEKSANLVSWKSVFDSIVFSGQAEALRTPISIHLDPTFRCNMKCVFCYDSSAPDYCANEMTLEEIKRIIDECVEMDLVDITYGGGEPFLRKDFMDIVRYTKERNIRIFILSNGTLITPEIAKMLAKCMDSRFDMIQISLDGHNQEVHERQRGVEGSFENTMTGIRNLLKAGIMPVINTVLTQNNYKHIPDMVLFLMKEGLTRFRVLRLHPLGRGRDIRFFNEWCLTPEQSEFIYEFLLKVRDQFVGEFHISNDNACIFPMSAKSIRDRTPLIPGKLPDSYACGAGTAKISIGSDGSVFPCSYMYEFPELKVGSIRENTILELWNKPGIWDIYRKPLTPSGKCNGCGYLHSCKTGCRILSYAFSGYMGAPDPGCHYQAEVPQPT